MLYSIWTGVNTFFQAGTSIKGEQDPNQIFAIIIPIVIFLGLAVFLAFKTPRISQWVSDKIHMLIEFIPVNKIAGEKGESVFEIIKDAGYLYDAKQDIFYSSMDAWQKDAGYCRLYDEAAAPMGMIIDCEPVLFEYDEKRWMIEFWKGQYDLTTGCEAGVYTTNQPDVIVPGIFTGAFYNSASDKDRLKISYVLKKNNTVLFSRKAKHWWLTGFLLGEYSDPADLTMNIKITLKNRQMRNAFINGLKSSGYSEGDIKATGNTVSFIFDKPRTQQPYTRTKESDRLIQLKNKFLCEQYQQATKDYKSLPDQLNALSKDKPEVYQKVFDIGKTKKIFDIYKTLKNYMG